LILAVEAGLVAVEERERGIGAGEGFEGERETVDILEVGEDAVDAALVEDDLVFEQGGFDGGVADDAPVGGGELADEVEFGFAFGLEVGEVVVEFGFVLFGGLVREDDGSGGESVLEGIERGGGFAGVGFGAGGFAGVGAGGAGFAVGGWHRGLL
jgi:hypothetical protein